MPPLRAAVTLLALTSLALGCSMPNAGRSGFLEPYTGFTPDEAVEGMSIHMAEGFDAGQWSRFLIDPVAIVFAPDAQGDHLDQDKLDTLTAYFHDELSAALAERYQVVTEPGPGVMRLRIAITDVKKTEPALNIHPATKLSGVGLGGASIEAEGRDTQTGRRLFAVIHTRPGNRLAITEGLEPLGHAKQAIDFWIEEMIERLDAAHGSATAAR